MGVYPAEEDTKNAIGALDTDIYKMEIMPAAHNRRCGRIDPVALVATLC
jgi:hypothetical protein